MLSRMRSDRERTRDNASDGLAKESSSREGSGTRAVQLEDVRRDGRISHSTRGDVIWINALPTEIRSKARVLGERGREGEDGKAVQK